MAKKKAIRYICPVCYGTVDLSQVHYSCKNPQCARMFLDGNVADSARYASAYKPEEEIDVEQTEFLGLDPAGPAAVTTKYHIIRGSVDGKCDVCGSKDTVKLCPRCHHMISKDAERHGTSIYVLMGSESTGKSHYLASLVELARTELSGEFGTRVAPASKNTDTKFIEEYSRIVFGEGKCLPPTPSYADVLTRDPLLYDLTSKDGDVRTLAVFDTSGRDLDRTDKLASLNISTYLASASGILFFVDPMQLPEVRRKLGLPQKDVPDVAEKLAYISEIVRDKNRLKPKGSIDIPLAVVLTKCDLLIRAPAPGEDDDALFGPESALHIPREKGSIDSENRKLVGTEIEEYLRRNAGQAFLDQVSRYEKREFFAVSALGESPSTGSIINGIAPYRVEDPMLWLLGDTERRKWF